MGWLKEVVISGHERFVRETNQEEHILYEHWLKIVQTHAPDDAIEEFKSLFIRAKDYNYPDVRSALFKIVNSKQAEQQFSFVLNRCCHILINRWQMQPLLQTAIPDLVACFDGLAAPNSGYSINAARLRQLLINFTKSDHYLKLQRLARVIRENKEGDAVGNLINRYPYLYEHYLLGEDSSHEDQQAVRQIQSRIQRNFELDLSQYVTYKMRQSQFNRRNSESAGFGLPPLRPVHNPTLLNEKELGTALKHFVGRVEGGYTYRDLSQSFISHTLHTPNYKKFKNDLYEYIISSVDSKYGRHQFNEKLYKKLQSILPHCEAQRVDEFIILRTTSQLMNFLVVESAQRPTHYMFVDMITNLGASSTVGLLLKLVLISSKVKPYVERRFSILFGHYEPFSKDGVPWLIKSLENLHIAFSVHFGKADLSFLRQIM